MAKELKGSKMFPAEKQVSAGGMKADTAQTNRFGGSGKMDHEVLQDKLASKLGC